MKRTSDQINGTGPTSPQHRKGTSEHLRDDLETLLTMTAVLGKDHPDVKQKVAEIERRYGQQIPLLMQISRLRGKGDGD